MILNLAMTLALMAGQPTPGELLVSGYCSNAVHRYDAVTGASLGVLDPAGGIMGPLGLTRDDRGRIYVASELTDSILRFTPGGDFLDAFVPAGTGGLTEPAAVTFGPDRSGDDTPELYVSSFDGDSILTFDGSSGAFVDVFVTPGLGGLNGPDAGMSFGPDGHLYVPSFWNSRVLRYDGGDGSFLGVFISTGLGGLQRPRTIVFEPGDTTMLVTSESANRIGRYDASSGALVEVLVTGISGPTGLSLDHAGFMSVASIGDDAVYRYDAATGAAIDTPVGAGAGGLSCPTFTLFIPAASCDADVDGDGTVAFTDLLAVLAEWGPCPVCDADVDGDEIVGFTDLLAVLAAWGPC
ncbi:MAG: hypothetical protein HKO59_11995 [Phycisphaerales bacterium]|nr:NHL repeat-containing protein [Phycisphaerae bacterium]NNF42094.1 hypothetical protein [Phycisphaerales bacterium]NNM26683.1 hypothetical protein [Phycisphaerales bacterium]